MACQHCGAANSKPIDIDISYNKKLMKNWNLDLCGDCFIEIGNNIFEATNSNVPLKPSVTTVCECGNTNITPTRQSLIICPRCQRAYQESKDANCPDGKLDGELGRSKAAISNIS